MGSLKLHSVESSFDICSDIDLRLVNPFVASQGTNSESDSDWKEKESHDNENAFDVFKDSKISSSIFVTSGI